MHLLAKYGVAFSFEVPVVKAGDQDFAASADWTPAAGDVKVSKDGGNVANIGTLPSAVGGTGSVLWTFTLSATEMQAARVTIQVVDSATKAIEDQVLIVQTYGNASAQHAVDLDDSVRAGLTALPNAAADAAGGLPISDAGGLDLDAEFGKLGTPTDFGSGTSTLAANLQDMADNGTATFDRATDSLQALRDHIGDGTNLTEAGGTGNQLTAVPWNSAWDAEVQSECADALVAIHLDHLFDQDYNPASKPGTATALLNELIESDSGVSRFTANSLEQGPVAAGFSTHSAADVWAVGARTLTASTNFNDISVADILTTQMTEAYAANGTAPTLAQGIFAIHQMLMQFAISGTSLTVRQLDNSTTAFVVTLDDGTNPTSAVRT